MNAIRSSNSNKIISTTRRSIRTLALAALCTVGMAAGFTPSANAVTKNFVLLGNQPEVGIVGLTENGGANYGSYYVGRYQATLNNATIHVNCVDLTHNIYLGGGYAADTDYHLTDAAGSLAGGYYQGGLSSVLTNGDFTNVSNTIAKQRSSESAYLVDKFMDASSFSGASGSTSLLDNLVAIQLTQWDILQNGGDGLGAGSFQTDAGAQAQYGGLVGYYENLAGQHSGYKSSSAYWIQAPVSENGGHSQDFAMVDGKNHADVPEPGVYAMFAGLAVSGIGFIRRRRSR